MDTDYIDVYLLHGLNRKLWDTVRELRLLDSLERVLAGHRVRYVGFSFHDDVRIFKEIVDGYDWSICQIQYNYYDTDYQAGREGLEYAASRGLGVVVMEPLRGGKLTGKIPAQVQKIWDSADHEDDPGRMGAALGLESSRSLHGAERNEFHESTRRKTSRQPARPGVPCYPRRIFN